MKNKITNTLPFVLIFVGSPILFYITGTSPRRTLVKEFFSIVTILSFCLMLGQFFLARTNKLLIGEYSFRNIITIHKTFGYVFLSVLLIHPLLVVLPRFYEAGISGGDAFIKMITTFSSPGIVVGICAWIIAFILGLTTILRKKLPLTYKIWRVTHGVLAIIFIVLAAYHAIDLGRHVTVPFAYLIVIAVSSGVLPLLTTYIFQSPMVLGAKK